MEANEKEQIQKHVLRVVEKSGMSIPVHFTERTINNSTGTFNGEGFFIELCLERLSDEFENQKNLGNHYPSLLHLADIVIAHELGHAKDQMERNFMAENLYNVEMIQRNVRISDKKRLKSTCRNYARYHYELEEIAWAYAKDFVLLQHEKEVFEQYERYCLKNYHHSYPYIFKMNRYALCLMQQWNRILHQFPTQKFNYTVLDNGYSYFDEASQTIFINLQHLLRVKPKRLNIPKTRYLFYQTLYMVLKNQLVEHDLETKVGDVYFSIFQNNYNEADLKEVRVLSAKRKKQTDELFQQMDEYVNRSSSSYLQFKQHVILEVENDLNYNFEFIEKHVKQHENKKKIS